MLSVPFIIQIAKVSQYLAQNDIDNKGLYGGGIDLDLPKKLYNIRKSVEWMYNQDSTDPSLVGTSEYLLALCSKYRAISEINLEPRMDFDNLDCFPPTLENVPTDSQFTIIRLYNLTEPGTINIGSDSNYQVSFDNVNWTSPASPDLPPIPYDKRNPDLFKLYVRCVPINSSTSQYVYVIVDPSDPNVGSTQFVIPVCGELVSPELFVSPDNLAFLNAPLYTNQLLEFYLSGQYLDVTDDIVITSPSSDYTLTIDGVNFYSTLTINLSSMTLSPTYIGVNFSPQSAGDISGNITVVGGGTSINVPVTGTGDAASLIAVPDTLPAFPEIPVGTASESAFFDVSGTSLQNVPGVITITAPSTDFQVSIDNTNWGASTTFPYTRSYIINRRVYVRFTPQSGGAKSGNISVSGGGGSDTVAVSGTAAAASLYASPLDFFGYLGLTVPFTNSQNYSATQTTNISAIGLDGTALNISGSANFQISLNGTYWTNGTLNLNYVGNSISATVYVRFAPLSIGVKSEVLDISGGGLTSPVNVVVFGFGILEFYMNVVNATRIKMQYVQSAATRILWGDSDIAESFGGSGTKNPDHIYTSAYTGYVIIQMDAYTDITQLYMNFSQTAASSITINAFYFAKLTALTNCVLDSKVSLIRYSAGSPMATSSLPQSLVSLTLYKADVGGTVQGLPPGLTSLDIRDNNTINGTIDELFTRCASLTSVLIDGSNTISGDIADIPNGVTSIKMFGNNTITCASKDLSVIPTSVIKFRILGLNTIGGSLQDISHWSTIEEFSIGGVQNAPALNQTSYITGTLNNITFSASLKIFQLTYGVNTVSGQLSTTTTDATHFQLPAGIETFELRGETNLSTTYGNTLIAAIGDFPTGLTTLNVGGNNTISGNLNTYSSTSIRTFVIDGSNTISGSVSSAPANVTFFQITGNTSIQTYTASRTWGYNGVMNWFALYSRVGGYTGFTAGTQSQLNQLFVDLNIAQWIDSSPTVTRKITYPRQGTVVPTGDGATALTSLTTVKGVTVTAQTY